MHVLHGDRRRLAGVRHARVGVGHPRRRAVGTAIRPAVPRWGGLASSPAVDAQAAAETQMMLWATNLAATDVVLHAAGWLEGGLTARSRSSRSTWSSCASSAGEHRLQRRGARVRRLAGDRSRRVVPVLPHTRAHFKEWLYMSPLFQTPDFATWEAMGSETTEVAANRAWKKAARDLRGSRPRPRDRRGAPGIHGESPRRTGSLRRGLIGRVEVRLRLRRPRPARGFRRPR